MQIHSKLVCLSLQNSNPKVCCFFFFFNLVFILTCLQMNLTLENNLINSGLAMQLEEASGNHKTWKTIFTSFVHPVFHFFNPPVNSSFQNIAVIFV